MTDGVLARRGAVSTVWGPSSVGLAFTVRDRVDGFRSLGPGGETKRGRVLHEVGLVWLPLQNPTLDL